KEIGAHVRRQHGKVPARTSAPLDPARPNKRNVAVRAHSNYEYYISGLIAAYPPKGQALQAPTLACVGTGASPVQAERSSAAARSRSQPASPLPRTRSDR